MSGPTLSESVPPAPRPGDPEPRRAARRLAIVSVVLAMAIYLLGWAGPEPELFRILNVLGLVTTVCALGLGRSSLLVWAAVASTVAAFVGVAGLSRLNGGGILAVMCSVPAALAVASAWIAGCGHTRWLPPTLFPPAARRPAPPAPGPRHR